jgi:Host cell surface-exposed lipoprotein
LLIVVGAIALERSRAMNKKHLAALATTVLLATSGVVAGGAQAAPFETALPLSPASHQNAVRAAQEHLAMEAYSAGGLIDQLVYEGFSAAQARYGVAAVGL